ncbi:hypothetical protein NMG60_11019773 [Bertholletia excelsa]
MMVAAVTGVASTDPRRNPKIFSQESQRRPPLLPSERNNNGVVGPKRPKSRQVSSRYINSAPSGSTPSQEPKRSVSVDRRRPLPSRPVSRDLDSRPGNAGEVSAATKLLFTSTRSLSVSFQGQAVRKSTPERRRSSTPQRVNVDGGGGGGDQVENSRPTDQLPWPARTRQPNLLSRSLDYSIDKNVAGSEDVIRTLQDSTIDERRVSFDGRLGADLSNTDLLKAIQRNADGNSANNESSVPSELAASDTDSVSSGSTHSGVQESGGNVGGKTGLARGIAVSARFWQETNNRLRMLQDSGSVLSTSPAKMVVPPKFSQSKRVSVDSPSSSPRTISSPLRGRMRPASPSKLNTPLGSSPSRGMVSPSRIRSSVAGTISCTSSETPSVLSFAVDIRRGKVGENRIVDAHLLRLLYNRHLQLRYVNARSEAAFLVQKDTAENYLWNAWIKISELRDAVTKKRYRLLLLRQKLKLASILKGQITCLEDCASLDKDQSVSLLGAIEALKASTLRLPVVGGAIADVQSIKDAIGSAVDVMQAMASSMCSLLSKVEEVNSLVSELAKVIAKEQTSLGQCKEFLSLLGVLQVKNCSLRTHILQLNRACTA